MCRWFTPSLWCWSGSYIPAEELQLWVQTIMTSPSLFPGGPVQPCTLTTLRSATRPRWTSLTRGVGNMNRALSLTPCLITLGLHPAGGTRWTNYIFLSASPSLSRFQLTCRSTTWLISFLPLSTTSASLSPPLLLTPPLLLPLLASPLPLCLLPPPPPPSPLVPSTPPVWTSPLRRRVSRWSWWRRDAAAWHWQPSWAPCSLCQSWRCWWCTWAGACSSTSPAATRWRSTCSTPHPSLWMSFTRRSSRCGRARPRRTKTTRRRRKTGRGERGVRRQGGVRSTPQRRTCGSWRRVEGEVWQTLGGQEDHRSEAVWMKRVMWLSEEPDSQRDDGEVRCVNWLKQQDTHLSFLKGLFFMLQSIYSKPAHSR